jgi:hypothetical protein
MKKFRSIYILVLIALTSCLDDITSINKNPKGYEKIPGNMLFANATRNLTDAITYGVTFKVLAQQWSETTYTDASRYNLPNVGNGFWNSMYRDVLRDYKEARDIITAETALETTPEVKQNRLDIITIMEAYTYSILVNTYGNVPYSEALDVENLQPKYDDGLTIYKDLFAKMDQALARMDADAESFGETDIVYGGDVAHWIKFGHSLKLRMALTLADSNPEIAKPAAEAAFASGELFSSNEDNAKVIFDVNPPNTNQIWVNLVQSGREDYVASNTLVDMMFSTYDPRITSYFNINKFHGYTGGKFGTSNNYGNFSHVGDMVVDPKFGGTLLDYVEVEFYLAEAAERGYTIGGTVEEHYTNAITASTEDWEIKANSPTAKAVGVTITTAGKDYKKGDILTVSGGTSTVATTIEVLGTTEDEEKGIEGIISDANTAVAGNYTLAPKGELTLTGGSGTGAKAKILYQADFDYFINDPDVAFATAPGTNMQKIARQKYIAMYNRGLEAWTEYRRLDFPVLNTVPTPLGDFPIRYTYPVNEQNLNSARWAEAAAAIGKDDVKTRVFWDTK